MTLWDNEDAEKPSYEQYTAGQQAFFLVASFVLLIPAQQALALLGEITGTGAQSQFFGLQLMVALGTIALAARLLVDADEAVTDPTLSEKGRDAVHGAWVLLFGGAVYTFVSPFASAFGEIPSVSTGGDAAMQFAFGQTVFIVTLLVLTYTFVFVVSGAQVVKVQDSGTVTEAETAEKEVAT